jgi:hypothetical protein
MCALPKQGHSGIQGNEYADSLAGEELSSLFLSPESVIPISSCAVRLEVKKWQEERHCEYWAANLSRKQSKLFTERPSG